MKKKCRVSHDSAADDRFIVHKPNEKLHFDEAPNGLHHHDVSNGQIASVQTVKNDKKKFTENQVARAEEALAACTKTGCPAPKDCRSLIKNCSVNDCSVTVEDVKTMEKIFGPNAHALKRKTVQRQPSAVEIDCIEVPCEIMKSHKKVTLTGDAFFPQGHPFFVSLSCGVKFNTTEDLEDMTAENLSAALGQVFDLCRWPGFDVTATSMDLQFKSVHHFCSESGVVLNACSADEHVPEIERFTRTLKEQICALRAGLPFEKIPHWSVLALVCHASE